MCTLVRNSPRRRFSLLGIAYPVVGKYFQVLEVHRETKQAQEIISAKGQIWLCSVSCKFWVEKTSFCLCKKNRVVIKLILYKKCSSGKVSPSFMCPCNKKVVLY